MHKAYHDSLQQTILLFFKHLNANPMKWSNTQTISRQKPTNCLSMFDHFVELALKGFKKLYHGMKDNQITFFFLISFQMALQIFWNQFFPNINFLHSLKT